MILTLLRTLRLNRRGQLGGVSLLIWLALMGPAVARDMRIAIRQGVRQLTVGSSTTAQLRNGSGQPIGQMPALESFTARPTAGAVTVVNKSAWTIDIEPSKDGLVYIGDRYYRGKVRLIRTSDGLMAINHVDLEDYLASVVGKEMYISWPIEALKAQAVAARSYALFRSQKRKSRHFDLGTTTTYQVYAGVDAEALSTQMATQSTAGQVLTYNGKVIEAVFHSSSGGHTDNSENIWMSAVPYLRGVPDFDQESPVYQWNLGFTRTQMRQRLPGVGNVIAMKPIQTTPTGRVKLMKIIGDQGSRTMKGRQLRKALGLKSTLFTVKPQMGLVAGQPGQVSSNPVAFQISGRGYGHGLGMSQWGAHGMAMQGKSYQDILSHYYRGTTLTTLP